MATINDIASELGISRGTVDRAIHNRAGIAPDVRERVLKKAKELGYTSNRAGRILSACKNPKRIGIFLPSIGNPFWDDVKKGIFDAEREYIDLGFSVELVEDKGFSIDSHLEYIEKISNDVDALIVATIDEEPMIGFLSNLDIPVATINTDLSIDRLFYVGPDYYEKGAINAALLSLLNRDNRIVIVQGSSMIKGHKDVIEGFENTLSSRGVHYSIVAKCESNDDDEVAYRKVHDVLANTNANTIFVATAGADGVVRAIGDKDIVVFSSDDVPRVKELVASGEIAWTVCQDPYTQGFESVKRMCDFFIEPQKKQESLIVDNIVKFKENIR